MNKVWINAGTNASNLSTYWGSSSGCFVECSESEAEKIHYYTDDHSAVKSTIAGKYESKWGDFPVVRHSPTQVPYTSPGNRRYYKKAPALSGPSLVLNAGSTYTISGTNGASVTWTCSSNLWITSSNNTSATAKVVSVSYPGGLGWIQASVGGASTQRHEVWVGKPVISGISGSRSVENGSTESYSAEYDYRAEIPNYGFEWILNPSNGCSIYGANTNFPYITFGSGSYQLRVRATNVNGTGNYYAITVNVYTSPSYSSTPPSSLYRALPNPASDELTITPNTSVSQSSPLSSSSGTPADYTVYLYNANGAVVKQAVSQQGGEVRIDVSGLPNGIYFLLIDTGNGNKPEAHKIIVNH